MFRLEKNNPLAWTEPSGLGSVPQIPITEQKWLDNYDHFGISSYGKYPGWNRCNPLRIAAIISVYRQISVAGRLIGFLQAADALDYFLNGTSGVLSVLWASLTDPSLLEGGGRMLDAQQKMINEMREQACSGAHAVNADGSHGQYTHDTDLGDTYDVWDVLTAQGTVHNTICLSGLCWKEMNIKWHFMDHYDWKRNSNNKLFGWTYNRGVWGLDLEACGKAKAFYTVSSDEETYPICCGSQ